jgi:protein-L-isoaspartate(D-aspartate) O-methyltransferase
MIEPQTQRQHMVDRQLRARGIRDPRVLTAMSVIPREHFLSDSAAGAAYADRPLAIGLGQTISQPYIVALMTEALGLRASDRVLEIGTGSGYSAAVLSQLAARVFTVERHPALANLARSRLAALALGNVDVRCGDGSLGWPEHAPFDAIAVTAAGPRVPTALLEQLAPGGRLVMPIDDASGQELVLVRREPEGLVTSSLGDVVFVPLIGEQAWPAQPE